VAHQLIYSLEKNKKLRCNKHRSFFIRCLVLTKKERYERREDYSLSFKLQVVSEVENEELSIKGALRKYGIQSHGTVLNWIRKYGTFEIHILRHDDRHSRKGVEGSNTKKVLTRTVIRYAREQQRSISFNCRLFGASCQVYYRRLKTEERNYATISSLKS